MRPRASRRRAVRRLPVASAFLAVLAVLAAACGSGGLGGAPAEGGAQLLSQERQAGTAGDVPPVVVGAVLDLTGPGQGLEAPVRDALVAEAARLNESGGILGVPVAVEVADNRGDVPRAIEEAGRVLDAGARLLVVGCGFDTAAVAAGVAQRDGVPVISACADDPRFGLEGLGSTAFSLGVDPAAQGHALAHLVLGSGTNTVLTVSELDLPETIAACDSFTETFTGEGGVSLGAVELADGGLDVQDVLDRVTAAPPAAVVSCAGPTATRSILNLLRSAGSPVAVRATLWSDRLVATAGAPAAGDLAVLGWGDAASAGAAGDPVVVDLEQRAGGPIGATGLGGAVALDVFAGAAAAAGSVEPSAVLPVLEAGGPFETVRGEVSFDADHRLRPGEMSLVVAARDGAVAGGTAAGGTVGVPG